MIVNIKRMGHHHSVGLGGFVDDLVEILKKALDGLLQMGL